MSAQHPGQSIWTPGHKVNVLVVEWLTENAHELDPIWQSGKELYGNCDDYSDPPGDEYEAIPNLIVRTTCDEFPEFIHSHYVWCNGKQVTI